MRPVEGGEPLTPDQVGKLVESVLGGGENLLTRFEIDLKRAVDGLRAVGPRELLFTLRAGESAAVARPSELLSELFGAQWVKPGIARLVRENAIFAE